jgi:hypothetical protein
MQSASKNIVRFIPAQPARPDFEVHFFSALNSGIGAYRVSLLRNLTDLSRATVRRRS